eukprot:m.102782 g.102782  ORF g.102782 m.102782 type:complete len:284 (+) comp27436_c0_seq1:488-1339(+)
MSSWPERYVVDVLDGRASRTMELVMVAMAWVEPIQEQHRTQLKAKLENEGSPSRRLLVLREWLSSRQQLVIVNWTNYGFPAEKNLRLEGSLQGSITSGDSGRVLSNVTVTNTRNSNRGLVIFDFDETLTANHAHFADADSVEAAHLVFGTQARMCMLQALLQSLANDPTLTICILTFNSTSLVQNILRLVGFAPQYISPTCVVGSENYTKLMSKASEINTRWLAKGHYDRVLFVDDSSYNVKSVRDECPSDVVSVLQVKRGKMNTSDVDQILNWAQRKPLVRS